MHGEKKYPSLSLLFATLAFCAAAGYSTSRLEFRLYPDPPRRHYCVRTVMEGLSAEAVDREISLPVSERLSRLGGIGDVRAVSSRGESLVCFIIDRGRGNEEILEEISHLLPQLEKKLPAGAHPPRLTRSSSDPVAVYVVSFPEASREEMESLARQIELLDGVAAVRRSTKETLQITALIHTRVSASSGISPSTTGGLLRNASYGAILRGGFCSPGGENISIEVPPSLTLQENSPLQYPSGLWPYSDKLFSLEPVSPAPSRLERINGDPMDTITVLADDEAGIISLCGKMEQLRKNFPEATLVFNRGSYLSAVLGSAVFAVLLGIAAVILLLLLQTGGYRRGQIYIFLTLPLSLGVSVLALRLSGAGLDIMSLSGAAVASGLIVDTSVLFFEESSVHGPESAARNLKGPVLIANGTTIVVFLPVLLLPPEIRGLFSGFMAVLASSIAAASLWTLFVLPSVLPGLSDSPAFMTGLHLRYRFVLKISSAASRLSPAGPLVLLILLSLAAFYPKLPGFTPFPDLETHTVDIEVEVPPGLTARRVDQLLVPIAAFLKGDSESLRTITTSTEDGGSIRLLSSDAVFLHRAALRGSAYAPPAGVDLRIVKNNRGTQGISVILFGSDPQGLRRLITETADRIQEVFPELEVYYHFKNEPFTEILSFLPSHCVEHRLSSHEAALQVAALFTALPAAKLQDGTDHDLLLRPSEAPGSVESLLRDGLIASPGGEISLSSLVEHRRERIPEQMLRLNGLLYTGLSLVPPEGEDLEDLADKVEALLKKIRLPAGYHLEGAPEIRENRRIRTKILAAVVLAALLVLLVISGYYGSLIPSLTVILHIPPPVVAALTVLRLTGTSLSIPVLSGMLVVIGISINNIVVLLPVASGTPCGPSNSPPSLRFAFSEKLPSLLASTATTATGVLPLFIGGLYRAGLPAGLSIVIASGAVSSFLLLFLSCGVFDSLLPRLFFQWRHEGTGPEG